MFSKLFEACKKNTVIENTLENGELLERAGQKESALLLYSNLVEKYPDCKACRYHMGKVAVELGYSSKEGFEVTPSQNNK